MEAAACLALLHYVKYNRRLSIHNLGILLLILQRNVIINCVKREGNKGQMNVGFAEGDAAAAQPLPPSLGGRSNPEFLSLRVREPRSLLWHRLPPTRPDPMDTVVEIQIQVSYPKESARQYKNDIFA